MNESQIMALRERLSRLPSRRDVLRGLASAGLGLGVLRWQDAAEAKKNHKKKHKAKKGKKEQPQPAPQPVFNRFGCLDVGQPCGGDSTLCCSGICEGAPPAEGQPDTRRCAAHGQGTCDQVARDFCETPDVQQAICNGSTCACVKTTAGSNFCGEFGSANVSDCAVCTRDADCELLGFPAGSACVSLSRGRCGGSCPTGFACLAPCIATVAKS